MSTYSGGDSGTSAGRESTTGGGMGTGSGMGTGTGAGAGMGSGTATEHRDHDRVVDVRPNRPGRDTVETKPSFKTTELIAYVLAVLGVLIASAMVDENEDGQGFGAESAWKYVAWLTIGYMIARGLAKAGSFQKDDDPRS
jgi:hypothetical protein